MESLLKLLSSSENIAVTALVFGNLGLSTAIVWIWRQLIKEREQDRDDRRLHLQQSTASLDKLTGVVTELRVIIAQCGLRRD